MTGNLLEKMSGAAVALLARKLTIECDHIPHHFRKVPLKKILNWLLVETSVFRMPSRPWGWPTHLQLEPTNICNLRCALCPVTEGLQRPPGHMSLDLFRRLIDEVGDYLLLILLWDWGEPFLNPDIYEMISYAKRRGIKTISSTNGHVAAREGHAEKAVRSGLDSLIFAVDGITQETYEQYRAGGSLREVAVGIGNVVEAKRRLASKTPFVVLRFIVMKHNEHEVRDLKEFARGLGVDALSVRTLLTYDDGRYCATSRDGTRFLPENTAYHRFDYDPKTHARIRRARNPCKALWNNPAVHRDGKVCPCTFDPHEKWVMGDLNRQSFRDIWFGPAYRRFRSRFRRHYRAIELCRDCTNAFEGGTCSTEDILEMHLFTKP